MPKPKFINSPKTFSEQSDILSARGLFVDERTEEKLSHTNYYRLSSFWSFYKQSDSKDFKIGTHFNTVWNDYRNDRQLRLLVINAIERIEVSFKTKLANTLSLIANSPFPHLDKQYLNNQSDSRYQTFLAKADEETNRSTEDFVTDFFKTYDEPFLPIWMLVEILSFGTVSKYYDILRSDIKKAIAKEYNLESYVFRNWLHFLSIARNMCCHHARFWRRKFNWKPPVLNRNIYSAWNPKMDFTEVYGLLCILKYFMNIIRPNSRWHEELDYYLQSLPDLSLLGFPENWKTFAPWN